jgi:hypothetical protein
MLAISKRRNVKLGYSNGDNVQSDRASVEEEVLSFVKARKSSTVLELYESLRMKNHDLTEADVTNAVWRLAEDGTVNIEDFQPRIRPLSASIRSWERNLWFYATMFVTLATAAIVYGVPADSPLAPLRWILGTLFVVFMPGYAVTQALFIEPAKLDLGERVAISIGLSLAIVSFIGYLLNSTRRGITIDGIVVSLSAIAILFALVGLLRQSSLTMRGRETTIG